MYIINEHLKHLIWTNLGYFVIDCLSSIKIEWKISWSLPFLILKNRMSIRCPCNSCCNMEVFTPEVVKLHLFKKHFLKKYTIYNWHGEVNCGSTSIKCDQPQS